MLCLCLYGLLNESYCLHLLVLSPTIITIVQKIVDKTNEAAAHKDWLLCFSRHMSCTATRTDTQTPLVATNATNNLFVPAEAELEQGDAKLETEL